MSFNKIIGNTEVKKYLENSVKNNNLVHSYLFLGTNGIGKLLFAKEFAKKILCNSGHDDDCKCKSCICFEGNNHPDLYVMNEEETIILIEKVRDLIEQIHKKPIMSEKKVIIINDFDKMKIEGQNCLLKTLEEPPEYVVIILISSNENNIINTIKSRCMAINFKNLTDEELLKYAKENLEYETISTSILKSFDGSIRNAITQKDFKEKFEEIDKLIMTLQCKDIIDSYLEGKKIFDKDNIYVLLDYMIVSLYSKKEENEKYIDCIQYVNKCETRLKAAANFDMSIDSLLFDMWEEINENRNRR